MLKKLLFSLIAYCFLFFIVSREIGGLPMGIFIEVFLLFILIGVIVKTQKGEWSLLNKDIVYLLSFWFVISIAEVINPGASVLGWVNEMRTIALYPLLMLCFGLLIFKTNKDLDIFLILIIALSTLGSLNGIKQLYIGLSPGEQTFLNSSLSTHLLWGRLRVFSFYSDAGQFGASQAYVGLLALVLALAPMKNWKRVLLLICAALNLYGMAISGTRGALFAIVVGGLLAIILSKNVKALVLGGFIGLSILFVLKFTNLGDGNYQIYRLRTALNPEDPSLNVRLNTQRKLRMYLSDYPFGGGLGVTGYNGLIYNPNHFLAAVPPDSLFVKIWMMYGIVGLTFWFGMMMFILGKCCGMVWNIQDKRLRIKMIALTAGFGGIIFCSYGNEVINIMPTSIVIYLSWAFIYLSPKLDSGEKSTLLI